MYDIGYEGYIIDITDVYLFYLLGNILPWKFNWNSDSSVFPYLG